MTARTKYQNLRKIIAGHGPMLVAYSGGVDSTLLAAVARDVLGEKTSCVLLDSPVVPRAAVAQAQSVARELGLALEIMPVPLIEHEGVFKNPPDRCYHCKKISAVYLKRRAAESGLACIADGINLSDTEEHRPGLRASDEEGIVHPFTDDLLRAGATIQELNVVRKHLSGIKGGQLARASLFQILP